MTFLKLSMNIPLKSSTIKTSTLKTSTLKTIPMPSTICTAPPVAASAVLQMTAATRTQARIQMTSRTR